MHVHVYCADGEAKFWLEPEVNVAQNHGLADRQLAEALQVAKERRDEIADAWRGHFGT